MGGVASGFGTEAVVSLGAVLGAEAIPLAVGLGTELAGEIGFERAEPFGFERAAPFGFEKTSFRLTFIIYYMQQNIKCNKSSTTINAIR